MVSTRICTVARLLAAIWLLGVALPASAVMEPCSNVPSGTQLQACLRSTLLDTDNQLNEAY